MLTKKFIFIFVVVVIVLVAVGVWFGAQFFAGQNQNPEGASGYSAVYLTTGDIYFGKLGWFPWPHMTEVWVLQRGANQQLGVAPLKSAFWGPVDEIYLNPKEIVLWTSLRNSSQLAQALANPSTVQQQQAQPPSVSPQLSTPTSTFRGPTGNPPTGR